MSSPMRRGPGRPRKLPVDHQRTLVLAAARKSFAAHGSQATIEQIAREAGVSRQSVYEQFGDKPNLFDQVVADIEEVAFAAVGANVVDDDTDLRSWARKNYGAMFSFVAEYPDALPVLQEAERTGDPAMTRLRSRLAQVYAEASHRRWAEYGVEPGRADTALVTMYFSMTEALVNLTWAGEPPDRDALIDLLTEFTIGGVLRLYNQAPDVITRMQ
jgi:AcrR family transcriptional regulator